MTFHENVLTALLDYKQTNPDFRFIPRQRNTKGRLDDGGWFQGNENYAFVALVNRSGGINMTKSVGLVFWPVENYLEFSLEVVYKGEENQEILDVYKYIINVIGGFEKVEEEKFRRYLGDTQQGFQSLYEFLDREYPKLKAIIEKSSHPDLLISEERFQKLLSQIDEYRSARLLKKPRVNLESLIRKYVETCQTTTWLDDELYKFEWARWLNEKADFDKESSDAIIFQLAIDSQKINYSGSTGVQFIKQGAREQMSKYIGIDDIRYFREFHEGKPLDEIGFEYRNMSFPIVSCWLSAFFPNKIYPVSRTSFADVARKVFNAEVSNSNVAFIKSLQPYFEQIDQALKQETVYQDLLMKKLKTEALNQLDFNWAAQDFMLFLDRNPEILNVETDGNNRIMTDSNLNQILFGPPGTGKTYNTINEALKIVDPDFLATHQNDRKKLTERFKELLIKNSDENRGQIAFCTFHQSFSYEDFVEGIKPKITDDKKVYYDIEPGVFKRICQLAESNNSTVKVINEGKISWTDDAFRKSSFYKLSLGEYNNPADRPIYEYCRDHGYIAIGFGEDHDFTGLSESEIREKCEDLKLEGITAQQLNYFIHYLKIGNYVIISSGNKYIRAIGKVTGEYEYVEESPIRYNHFRKVEWLFVDENIPIEEIYERGLSQKTMYKIDESALKPEFFTNQGQKQIIENKVEKKFVLIIDEINRGNVSAIFGELITLIEKDKRAGKAEELEVTLPYSKEPFKVPSNVYIIGTLNTADRSIEALDTALRRRFSFKEFPPKPNIIVNEGVSRGNIDGINLVQMLAAINQRIEKLIDKDHMIGHSYFIDCASVQDLQLAFKDKVIPLLEEYFFGDFGKIGLIIGSSFIKKTEAKDFAFAVNDYDPQVQQDLALRTVYKINPVSEWDYKSIYEITNG